MKKLVMLIGNVCLNIHYIFHVAALFMGSKFGLVRQYEESLISKHRTIYFGGMPNSVILLIPSLCNGKCYDRGTMISLGMENFTLCWGSIGSLRLAHIRDQGTFCGVIYASDHLWVESNGWVYDTTRGYKTRKWLYYLLETPLVRSRKNQDWCKQQEVWKEGLINNIDNDKYTLPLVIPCIEQHLSSTSSLNHSRAKKELELFKTAIGYDALCEEVKADMKAKGFST